MLIKKELLRISIIAALISAMLAGTSMAQQPSVQARAVQPAAVLGDLLDIMKTNDGQLNTRATSGKADYVGMSVTVDVGGEQNIIGVIQDHGRWPTHYPGAYKVEVALSPNGPWMKTFEGPGNRGESKTVFEAVRARFIRITATAAGGGADDWSIAELKAGVDPGVEARTIPAHHDRAPDISAPPTAATLKDLALAFDKNRETRATSGTPDYAGMSFTFDLGGEYELSRIAQLHGQWAEDYPSEYKVEVSRQKNESKFREIWRGRGEPSRSVARFDPVITRYIRITALEKRDRTHWWSIAEVRTNRDPDVAEGDDIRLDRTIRRVTARGLSNIDSVLDEDPGTHATTGSPNYTDSWVLLDLGGSYTISNVVQVHDPNDRDFPGRYRIEVSETGNRWQMVWEGEGESGRSRADFAPARARFVRITATANKNNRNSWSISKVRVSG